MWPCSFAGLGITSLWSIGGRSIKKQLAPETPEMVQIRVSFLGRRLGLLQKVQGYDITLGRRKVMFEMLGDQILRGSNISEKNDIDCYTPENERLEPTNHPI